MQRPKWLERPSMAMDITVIYFNIPLLTTNHFLEAR